MRYALKVQYIGKNYAGSQLQPDRPTIQEELERAICTLTIGKNAVDKRPVKVIFSGRTDAGVNSRGQVIHFDTKEHIVASKFMYQINEIVHNLKAGDSN